MTANRSPIVTAAQLDELEALYPGDMVRGYRDGMAGAAWPDRDPSPAYEHGRRNGINDRAHTVDQDQRALAADVVRRWRL
jgi:hypothetical protein